MKGFLAVAAVLSLSAAAAIAEAPQPPQSNMPAEEDVEDASPSETAKSPKRVVPGALPSLKFGERPKTDGVELQALDKITAHVTGLSVALDQPVQFGTLVITARACAMRPPEEEPESAAFLDIEDIGKDAQAKQVFSGWMFASSPALSPLEHPVYDVWVKSCKIAAGVGSKAPSSSSR